MTKPEQDKRYRAMVLLQRADRPTQAKFHCPFCRMPLVELVNADVVAMTDVIDFENTANMGPGYKCHGRTGTGHCETWWYFTLGAVNG